MKKSLRTSDLAKAGQLSVQAIRNYEAWNILPAAERSAKGYRLYTSKHLQALSVTQSLIAGYGWQCATNIMQCMHRGDFSSALALIDARHAEIHQNRSEIEETLRILRMTSSVQSLKTDMDKPTSKLSAYACETAKMFGVRVSALRYWEERGLLQPKRNTTNHYRIYDEEQIRKLQFIVALRKANYNVNSIRYVLDQLTMGSPEQALDAAENRLRELVTISYRCMQATADLWMYAINTLSLKIDLAAR